MAENQQSFRTWARSRKFVLSRQGRVIQAEFIRAVVAARGIGGQPAFEAARREWAARHALHIDHAMYLSEVRREPISLTGLGEALAICSQSRDDVIRCMEHLVKLELVLAENGSYRNGPPQLP